MEHEVHVPMSVGPVRAALAEQARVARCVPGLQLDAGPGQGDGGTVAGRLRFRVAGSTITYRGTLDFTRTDEGLDVAADAAEARGDGVVRLSLTVRPEPAADGEDATRLVFTGELKQGDGRIADVASGTATAAAKRLLDRFAAALADSIGEEPPRVAEESTAAAGQTPDVGLGAPDDNEPVIPNIPGPETGEEEPSEGERDADEPTGVFAAEIPPPSLDPLSEEDGEDVEDVQDESAPATAEAAHARRTMIGRSAEEVDHAPPRGRYAPEPATGMEAGAGPLRWAAPAAAVVVAGAVVIARALRKRG
ncbi:MAG TPA: hypothetical protein VFH77_03945 [Streptomyces sp.]|nr:hypothetical protein [Streptomyces sp.]